MWSANKLNDHKGSNSSKLKSESDVKLELIDNLRSLLATVQSDFC